ncbi:hypothetical protein [Alkalicoccus urumqiensis]|nr:hypothetical protein [Alkalicoccus urumqiensis]
MKLKWRARGARRMIEKVKVYPYPVQVQGTPYYLVEYIKFRQPQGRAVIGDPQTLAADVPRAHEILFHFYALSEKIQTDGRMRAAVQIDFFKKPLDLTEDNPHPDLQAGRKQLSKMLQLQLRYRRAYDRFQETLQQLEQSQEPITKQEMEQAEYTAGELEVLQYDLVRTIADNTEDLGGYIRAAEKHGHWEKLTKSQQVFLRQLIKNESLMKQEYQQMDVSRNGPLEERIDKQADKMRSYKHRDQKEEQKLLRVLS